MGRDDLGVQAGPRSGLVIDTKAADTAAARSLKAAFVSVGGVAAGLWLATLTSIIAFLLIGLLVWLVLWILSLGLGIGALRTAWSSPTPAQLRKKAGAALGIDAFSLLLVIMYISVLWVASSKLQ